MCPTLYGYSSNCELFFVKTVLTVTVLLSKSTVEAGADPKSSSPAKRSPTSGRRRLRMMLNNAVVM